MQNQVSRAYVAMLNGRLLTRSLITYSQLYAIRELFRRRAHTRRVKVTTPEVDDALWVLLETGVLLPPFDDENEEDAQSGQRASRSIVREPATAYGALNASAISHMR
jgi:hypothetical protein